MAMRLVMQHVRDQGRYLAKAVTAGSGLEAIGGRERPGLVLGFLGALGFRRRRRRQGDPAGAEAALRAPQDRAVAHRRRLAGSVEATLRHRSAYARRIDPRSACRISFGINMSSASGAYQS